MEPPPPFKNFPLSFGRNGGEGGERSALWSRSGRARTHTPFLLLILVLLLLLELVLLQLLLHQVQGAAQLQTKAVGGLPARNTRTGGVVSAKTRSARSTLATEGSASWLRRGSSTSSTCEDECVAGGRRW